MLEASQVRWSAVRPLRLCHKQTKNSSLLSSNCPTTTTGRFSTCVVLPQHGTLHISVLFMATQRHNSHESLFNSVSMGLRVSNIHLTRCLNILVTNNGHENFIQIKTKLLGSDNFIILYKRRGVIRNDVSFSDKIHRA